MQKRSLVIEKHIGNLLDVEKGIIVHGCNCHGVMGSGVAKAIRQKWPEAYTVYSNRFKTTDLFLGDIVAIGPLFTEGKVFRHLDCLSKNIPENVIVVNAMTQYDYGANKDVVFVDYDALAACFARIKIIARDAKLPVHFPLIGCGLANGDWDIVSEIIDRTLGDDIEKHLWVL